MTEHTSPALPANDALPASENEPTVVQLPTPFVVIATPSLKHECSMWHRQSTLAVASALVQRGIPHVFMPEGGITYLDRARDVCATRFLEDFPTATDLFFWDDDVGGENLVEPFFQFLMRPEPILIGATPLKNDDRPEGASFPVRFLATEDGRLIQNNGLIKVDRGPAGFMRVKRQVLEAIIAADRAVQYREPHSQRLIRHFFSCGVMADDDGQLTYWGEDTIFIARAALLGIETWVEPNITFRHDGRKSYVGNCHRELLRQHGPQMLTPLALEPSHVAASPQTPTEGPMIEYPKMVRGLVAQDAEDESRIEREWQAANPGTVAMVPELVDTGIAPDGVAASTPVVADDQLSTEQLEAKIEADLSDAAALTVQVAGPADQQGGTDSAENTVPSEQPASVSAAVGGGTHQGDDPTVPVAPTEVVSQAFFDAADENQRRIDAAVPDPSITTAHVKTAERITDRLLPEASAEQRQASIDSLARSIAQHEQLPESILSPATEPAAALADEPAAPASESPEAGANPAAVAEAEPAQTAEPAQEAPVETVEVLESVQSVQSFQPAETPIAALDAGAAAAGAGAPETISAPVVAAEAEQAAPGASPAPADAPAADTSAEPPGPSQVAEEAPIADSDQPAAAVTTEQQPAEAEQAAAPDAASGASA